MHRQHLKTAVSETIGGLMRWKPELAGMMVTKAVQDYDNALVRIVLQFMLAERTTPGEGWNMPVEFSNAIESGLREAFWIGARENDVTDMEPEWQVQLDTTIAEEITHIPDLFGFLTESALSAENMGEAYNKVRPRLDLWTNRYNDVVNMAKVITADNKTKLEWIYGDTEHCETCSALNGIVMWAWEWEGIGVRPQNPPNSDLSCGGWRCQCRLEPTKKRRTSSGYGKVEEILMATGAR